LVADVGPPWVQSVAALKPTEQHFEDATKVARKAARYTPAQSGTATKNEGIEIREK